MINRILFILTIIPLFFVSPTDAQDEWKLKKNEDGIEIYSKPYAGSKIRALKVTCRLEATLSQLVAVLLDIKSQDEWFYHTKSFILKPISSSELYYYAELEFPFPFSNRDFVEHITLQQDAVSKVVSMTVENVPEFIPAKQNIVRVLQSSCYWTVTPLGKNLIRVEFTLFADPAGSIPAWVVNMFSLYGPYETFKKLKIQLNKPAYKNAHFPFIRD